MHTTTATRYIVSGYMAATSIVPVGEVDGRTCRLAGVRYPVRYFDGPVLDSLADAHAEAMRRYASEADTVRACRAYR